MCLSATRSGALVSRQAHATLSNSRIVPYLRHVALDYSVEIWYNAICGIVVFCGISKEVQEMAKAQKQEKSMEAALWEAANKLRGNVEPSEYKHVVLSLIFL